MSNSEDSSAPQQNVELRNDGSGLIVSKEDYYGSEGPISSLQESRDSQTSNSEKITPSQFSLLQTIKNFPNRKQQHQQLQQQREIVLSVEIGKSVYVLILFILGVYWILSNKQRFGLSF
jgi:hypothetical protein